MPDLTSVDFKDIYCTDEAAALQPDRYAKAIKSFSDAFSGKDVQAIFSAPGRTEIGGNHTDHQHGEVLAASINKDAIAAVSVNGSDKVNVLADGFLRLRVINSAALTLTSQAMFLSVQAFHPLLHLRLS